MKDGIFCSDHELLWIAHAGCTSHNLKRRHKKPYAQFMKQYRIDGLDLYRELFKMSSAASLWAADQVAFIKKLDRIVEEMHNVQSTTLRGSGKDSI